MVTQEALTNVLQRYGLVVLLEPSAFVDPLAMTLEEREQEGGGAEGGGGEGGEGGAEAPSAAGVKRGAGNAMWKKVASGKRESKKVARAALSVGRMSPDTVASSEGVAPASVGSSAGSPSRATLDATAPTASTATTSALASIRHCASPSHATARSAKRYVPIMITGMAVQYSHVRIGMLMPTAVIICTTAW